MLGNSEDTMTVTESARSVRRVQKPCAFVQFSVAQHSVSVEHLVEARQTATCDIYTFRLLLYPSKFSCQLFFHLFRCRDDNYEGSIMNSIELN